MFRQNDTTAELDVGKKDLDLGEKKEEDFSVPPHWRRLQRVTELIHQSVTVTASETSELWVLCGPSL